MAGGLKIRPVFFRRWGLAILVLPVVLMHLWLGLELRTLIDVWQQGKPMPPRLQASFVRELTPLELVPAPRKPVEASRPNSRHTMAPKAWQTEPLAASPALEASAVPAQEALSPELAASAPPLLLAEAQSDEPGPEWPPSTRLSHELTGNYRGAIYGDAQVEWLREGRHYQMHLDVSIGPSIAPLMARRMSSDGVLSDAGISPKRYDEDTRVVLSQRRRATVQFDLGKVTLADGRSEVAPAGTQDAASQFVQLTWLFLTGRQAMRPGLVVELPLALPRRQYLWRYEVIGQEDLQTPMGPLNTWHLRPSVLATSGDMTAEVWLAPSLQYLPVRIRIRQDAQTFVDLMLKSPALQAAADPPTP
nr:DUF3108 domain-containing protein [uncultured Roseateles sp.]